MKTDAAAIVALVAVLGSGVGWIISVERRIANRVKTDTMYAKHQLMKQSLSGEVATIKAELDTDIRSLRNRLNSFQSPACPPCPIASKTP